MKEGLFLFNLLLIYQLKMLFFAIHCFHCFLIHNWKMCNVCGWKPTDCCSIFKNDTFLLIKILVASKELCYTRSLFHPQFFIYFFPSFCASYLPNMCALSVLTLPTSLAPSCWPAVRAALQ